MYSLKKKKNRHPPYIATLGAGGLTLMQHGRGPQLAGLLERRCRLAAHCLSGERLGVEVRVEHPVLRVYPECRGVRLGIVGRLGRGSILKHEVALPPHQPLVAIGV